MKDVETLSVMEKTISLAKWELFERLATDEVALIAARTGEVEYEAGEVIDADGPTGSSLHLILRGRVELSVDGVPFRRAGVGEAFGGMAVLGDPMPGDEQQVLEPTHALVLSREGFKRAVADHPEFALAVIRGMAELIRESQRAAAKTSEEH
ncbi:MAG: Crp/Fnr family transcriptional regulator [Thermoanaerobaculia bacterium]